MDGATGGDDIERVKCVTQNYSLRPGEKGEWIPAVDAVHLLAPRLGSDRKAKKALVERLKDSAVDATAWWIATGYDVGTPYVPQPVELPDDQSKPLAHADLHDLIVARSKPEISLKRCGPNKALTVDEGKVFIGGAFWNSATKEDQKQWDWSLGLFKCSYPSGEGLAGINGKPPSESSASVRIRMYALGVHFHRPHVLRIIEASTSPIALTPEPSNRGRKRSPFWPRWIAEVISLHHEEGIGSMNAHQLVQVIEERMALTGYPVPSKKTVHETAMETLNLLKERQAAGG